MLIVILTLSWMNCVWAGSGSKVRIKMATLAPEGTTWMKIMHQMSDEIEEKTEGRVSFSFYPGGISGDEKDMLRKAKAGFSV